MCRLRDLSGQDIRHTEWYAFYTPVGDTRGSRGDNVEPWGVTHPPLPPHCSVLRQRCRSVDWPSKSTDAQHPGSWVVQRSRE